MIMIKFFGEKIIVVSQSQKKKKKNAVTDTSSFVKRKE